MNNAFLTPNGTIRAGIVQGPGDQAYQLLRDIPAGAGFTTDYFEAIGGAPQPMPGDKMPDWLVEFFSEMESRQLKAAAVSP